MSADKRTPHTDALDTLGYIITGNEGRDAVHLAVQAAQAAQKLKPGEHVGYTWDGRVGRVEKDKCVGIVDPFLVKPVPSDEWFWLIVYPRKIKSLRHVWEWDAIDKHLVDEVHDEAAVARLQAERYVQSVADGLGVERDELMAQADIYQRYDDYWCQGGRFEGEYINPEFWKHWEVLTGMESKPGSDSFLGCSC